MENDRAKWDERYGGERFFLGPRPSRFLEENIDLVVSLCPGRKALDIACGEGRNSIFLARHGFAVTGLDISAAGIAKARARMAEEGVTADFRVVDLEGYVFTETYDLIINFNFLLRDLIPKGVAALSPGGVFVFDTIMDSPALVGHHTKRFLLQPGELRRLFEPLPGTILQYEELPLEENPTAKLIFQKKG